MRKLVERIGIETPKQAVWDVMADFGKAATWAPGMRWSRLEGERKSGVGTHRIMRHTWGFKIDETVTQWTDGTGYSFELVKAPFPMCDVHETWMLKQDDVQVLLTVGVSYSMRLGLLGALLDAVLVRFVVAREMRSGIRGLKRHVESGLANTAA